jgi:Ni/Co efflux regulator RcnB
MNNKSISTINSFALLVVIVILSTPAFAEKSNRGDYNHDNADDQQHKQSDDYRNNLKEYSDAEGVVSHRHGDLRIGVYFKDHHHKEVHDYYHEEFDARHCPPGLAKKNNGCIPPGREKRWRMGYPLPRDIIFYDIAPGLAFRLGPPPAGHRYVRVATDILLIALGSGMVIDGIEDLGDR